MGEKCPGILPKCYLPRYIYKSFTCRKAMTWDRRLYFPSEGRRAEDFFALKIRRLRPGANPQSRVPEATKLPLRPPKPLAHKVNPLNPELNPICYLLALLGAHHFLHVSRIRVKLLTLRRLMSYIYMEHPFLMFLHHTQRRSTVGRTPLDE